jgi:UDP-GlcNAc:undecaprenyl-phosphate GlcNAc-1-phosphate transferase
METYVLIFAGALAFAIGGTPIARRLAWQAGITDEPSPRKVHREPMPLLGGAAIYVAAMLALLAFGDRQEIAQLAGILIGATLVSFIGLWDDRRPLRPVVKLAGQFGAVAVLMVSGVRVQLTGLWPVDGLLTIGWVLAITNAINFLDNMDGLAGGVSAIAAASFLLLAVANQQLLVAPLSAAVLGACVGFLVYNFNPATIFMGDHGSLFLGFVLAALGIKLRFPLRPVEVTWMIPILVLAVPLFDLALVVVSRLRRGVNPFTTGGTDHLSHRLVRRGMTPREAALTVYLVTCATGGLAIFVSHTARAPLAAWLVLAGVLAAAALAIWRLELAPPAPS